MCQHGVIPALRGRKGQHAFANPSREKVLGIIALKQGLVTGFCAAHERKSVAAGKGSICPSPFALAGAAR
jgi:hypothetical protein